MVDDCTNFYGNSRRAGFHDPCGFVTDRYIHRYTKVITEESPFRALGVPSLQPIIKERSNICYCKTDCQTEHLGDMAQQLDNR